MTFRGHIQNGRVVADGRIDLPDGTIVDVNPTLDVNGKKKPESRTTKSKGKSVADRYRAIIGIAPGLPSDLAANHGHYARRKSKR